MQSADPPGRLRLESGDVHVWLVNIDSSVDDETVLSGSLSDDELHRARRLVFDADRRRFLVSHLVLRALLGRYLGTPASRIELTRSALGKPRLADPAGVDFNLAHSGNLVACVFALDRQVGIDVERIRPALNVQALAERYFTPAEVQAIRETAERDRPARFFTYWVRKEAVLKATGHGLSLPLSAVDVSSNRSPGSALAHVQHLATDWHVVDLAAGEEYRAAVAIDRLPRRLSCRQMPSDSAIGYR